MQSDFAALRKKMVQEQLIAREIKDPRVLKAFGKVPREKFVQGKYLNSAYDDCPLPIGSAQTISQPYMVALMTQCLELSGGEKVLEIGSGSGYQTAILAELSDTVYSVERIDKLAQRAKARLEELNYHNVQIKLADGTLGWAEHAPYQGIIVTAAAAVIPRPLIQQLDDNGRLVIPIGTSFSQVLTVVYKRGNKIEVKEFCGCVFVPLIGKYGMREKNA